MIDNSYLLNILKQVIDDLESRINKIDSNNRYVVKYKKDINKIRNDFTKVIDIDLDVVEQILNEVDISIEEQEIIFDYISIIKEMLVLNKEVGTTFEIDEEQLDYLNKFIYYVNVAYGRLNNNKNKLMCDELNNKKVKYSNLYDKVLNGESITDISVLEELIKESLFTSVDRKNIMTNIMKYNNRAL